jgi:hypothetical protein
MPYYLNTNLRKFMFYSVILCNFIYQERLATKIARAFYKYFLIIPSTSSVRACISTFAFLSLYSTMPKP